MNNKYLRNAYDVLLSYLTENYAVAVLLESCKRKQIDAYEFEKSDIKKILPEIKSILSHIYDKNSVDALDSLLSENFKKHQEKQK